MALKVLGIVVAEGAPKAIGPYSQAVVVDGMVYTAGQIPLDPRTGEVVGRTTAEHTARVLQNLPAVLEATGLRLSLDAEANVHLVEMADFPAGHKVSSQQDRNH